jgi:hypothetical protein
MFRLTRKDLHPKVAQWYTDYIASPEWRAVKDRILVERREACERCDSLFALSFHHKTYARLFAEDPRDVEILCKDCHYKAHQEDYIPLLHFIYEPDLQWVKACLVSIKDRYCVAIPQKRSNPSKTKTKEGEAT